MCTSKTIKTAVANGKAGQWTLPKKFKTYTAQADVVYFRIDLFV